MPYGPALRTVRENGCHTHLPALYACPGLEIQVLNLSPWDVMGHLSSYIHSYFNLKPKCNFLEDLAKFW